MRPFNNRVRQLRAHARISGLCLSRAELGVGLHTLAMSASYASPDPSLLLCSSPLYVAASLCVLFSGFRQHGRQGAQGSLLDAG